MLRYRAREYDTALRYHRDEHFNMIRNWVGQIGDEAFYDAADRYGVVVWQDFWLANPWDGPDPDDNDLFLANAKDYLLRIRNHASLGIFCGRNEGFRRSQSTMVFASLSRHLNRDRTTFRVLPMGRSADTALIAWSRCATTSNTRRRSSTARWDRRTSSSWMICAGPCRNRRCGRRAISGRCMIFTSRIHSPQASTSSTAAQRTSRSGMSFAQFVNYDAYRGMFEGQSKNRLGLLIWMSHPAWPSLLWQTYDYFFDTDAGYYGAKKASEPLHIQWNAATDAIEVVNYSAGDQTGLTAHAQMIKSGWNSEVGEDSDTRQPRGQHADAHPTGVSGGAFAHSFHSADSDARQTGRVVELLSARTLPKDDYQGIRDTGRAKVRPKTRIKRQRIAVGRSRPSCTMCRRRRR